MESSAFALAPATVVAGMCEHMEALRETLWVARTPTERLTFVQEVERLRSVMDVVELEVINEIDIQNDAPHDGWATTKDFVTAVTGGRKGSGRSAVKLAAALSRECRRTADALAAGRLSRLQAQVIVKTVESLPIDERLRRLAEENMLENAKTLDATDLWTAGQHLIGVLDPERDEREQERRLRREERAAHLNRHLSITDDGAGGVRIKGRTTVEDAAVIKAALMPLAAPEPTGKPGECGGKGDCATPDCAHDGRDPREHGARMLDALVEACQRVLDAQVGPTSHGAKPRLTITMTLADLQNVTGPGITETGDTLSATAIRRLACDAHLTPVVLGTEGEVLDVGRTRRLVTEAIWKALVVRDKHCTFPGCSRPPIACDAHHIVHWVDGGGTGLDNLALLCRRHHTIIHTTGWEIRLKPDDRRPEFLPPSRLDPERKPLRLRIPRQRQAPPPDLDWLRDIGAPFRADT